MITENKIKEQIETLVKNEIYCTAGDVVEVYEQVGKIDPCETVPPELCPLCCSLNWVENENKTDDHPENYFCPDCNGYFDYLQEQEVFEWHFVSEFLADYLERVGAVVVRTDWLPPIWGRTETGQSITIDSDIEQAAILILQEIERITNKYKK